MKYKYGILLLVFFAVMIVAVAKWISPSYRRSATCSRDPAISWKSIPSTTSQVMVVKSLGGSKAEITACQRQGNQWLRVLTKPFPGVIGKRGLAPVGEKQEGDLKTPVGAYPLGEVFGTEPLAIKMDYKYITPEDKFVDDVTSESYNSWISGETNAKSYEPMFISAYKMGIVVNYNMKPTIPGAGSAIFVHLWGNAAVPTQGCVAMDEQHLLMLLHWLDKKQHPYIYIVPDTSVANNKPFL